jgi:hypothetical protein
MFDKAVSQYQFIRAQQQLNPVDACTDVAQFFCIPVAVLAAELIVRGIDVSRLSLI